MAREKKMKDYWQTLYEEYSPVVVDKMHLYYNNDYGVNALQITFRNVTLQTIYGLSIVIETFDEEGNPTPDGQVEYNYYDLEVPSGKNFGNLEDIVMEDEADSFTIRVIRAEYADGQGFRGDVLLRPMPDPKPLEELGDLEKGFRARVAEKKPALKLHCIPEKKSYYWRCSCKRIYSKEMTKCRACNVERDWITGIIPQMKEEIRLAEEEKAARIFREQQEKERLQKEEEERLAEEARQKEEEDEIARLAEDEARRQEAEEAAAREEAECREREEALRKKKKMQKILIALAVLCVAGGAGYKGVTAYQEHARLEAQKKKEAEEEAKKKAEEEKKQQEEEEAKKKAEEEQKKAEEEKKKQEEEEAKRQAEEEASYGQDIVIMGVNLTDQEKSVVMRLMGMDQSELDQSIVIPVSMAQEAEYTGTTNASGVYANVSKSCTRIRRTKPGSGLQISLFNITSCTEDMYRAELQKAGINDAEVVVASANLSAGTVALAGISIVPQYVDLSQSTQ